MHVKRKARILITVSFQLKDISTTKPEKKFKIPTGDIVIR